MPLQITGVQFVNQGLSGALNGLTQYNQAFVKTTQTIVKSTSVWNQSIDNSVKSNQKNINNLGDTLKNYNRTVTNNISKSSTDASRSINILSNNIMNFSNRASASHAGVLRFTGGIKNLLLAMSGFILLKRIINDVFDSLRNLWDSMIEGASNTQLLSIRFQNLTAISIQNTQKIEDYATALAMAKGPAEDLLNWVNVMASKTMFGRDAIADVLGLGMAFDMTAGQSQTLTQAMVDWASGMGLGEDALQRMVVNFGQMLRMGKITQRELRDLAIGGLFPVNEALRRIGEQAGFTGDQLKDFMQKTATSGVPVNALLTEFVKIAEERFPNAGVRMAQTWAGVTQNIKDFVTTILGAALLGPTMDKIVGGLAKLLDQALSPAVRAAATVIGEKLATSLTKIARSAKTFLLVLRDLVKALGIPIPSLYQIIVAFEVLADVISSGLNTASSAIRDWIDNTGTSFTESARKFFSWGFNIIEQFAAGIISGITTVLVTAMNLLSAALAWFLGPGSPPRVAPYLDVWGKSAMNEFLKGMTKADFDILSDLQGPLQSALTAMAQLGLIAQDQVGSIFYDISKQIIAAMHELERTGKVSESVFRSIRRAGGELGDELEELARRQFALLAATKELEKAQRQLNDARKADDTAKQRVDDLIKDYRALVEAGASKDILEAKRAEIKAAMDMHDQTKQDVILSEDKVKAAEDALAPLREAVNLQEQMVKQMIALVQAQAKAAQGGAGAEAGGAFGALGDALKEFDSDMKMSKIKFDLMAHGISLTLEKMKEDFKTKLGGIFKPLTDAIDTDILPKLKEIEGAFDKLLTPLTGGKGVGDLLGGIDFSNIANIVGQLFGVSFALTAIWKAVGLLLGLTGIPSLIGKLGGLGGIAGIILSPLGKIGLALGILGLVVGLTKKAWDEDFLGMQTTVTTWYESNKTKIQEIINLFSKGNLQAAFGNLGQVFLDAIKGINWGAVATSIATGFLSSATTLYGQITTTVQNINWTDVGATIGKLLGTAITNLIVANLKFAEWFYTVAATTDWSKVAQTIWKLLGAMLVANVQVLLAFLETLGGIILGFIINFDWGEIAKALWNTLVAALVLNAYLMLGALKAMLDLLKWQIETAVDIYKKVFDIAWAILKIIGKAFFDAGKWLLNQIIDGLSGGLGIDLTGLGIPLKIKIPNRATGGIVTQKGLYSLAERGPEMVIPAHLTRSFMDMIHAFNGRTMSSPTVAARPVYNNSSLSNSRTYNLNMSTVRSSGQVSRDFSIMETLAG